MISTIPQSHKFINFQLACSKYQSVKVTNTKIQLNKSVFGMQVIFSRLIQILAGLRAVEFPATGDDDDEMMVDNDDLILLIIIFLFLLI